MSRGMGRGAGRGIAGGIGHHMRWWDRRHRGMGVGQGGKAPAETAPGSGLRPGASDELGMLKDQARHLQTHLGEIQHRIKELEKEDKK